MNQAVNRMAFSWLSFWVVSAAVGLAFLMPLDQSVRRGIDLAGGSYITLSVQSEKAVDAALFDLMETAAGRLKSQRKEAPRESVVQDGVVRLTFKSMESAEAASSVFRGLEKGVTHKTTGSLVELNFSEKKQQQMKDEAVARNIEVLRTRLDKLGVGEIMIAAQGERNIVIELPGVTDPQQAKAMIGTAAVLEFKLVEKSGPTEEDILYEYDGELPPGKMIVSDSENREFYLVSKRANVSGKYLRSAESQYDQETGRMAVGFTFSGDGSEKFYDVTSKNIGKVLAAILDNTVVTAATIQSGIRGSGRISGNFDRDRARELALLLKSGSFVAPVLFEEERQVGPTLGQEAIEQGLWSCLVGLGLLFLFSLYYYSLSGLFAFIALLYNLALILIGVALLGATLTLPGIGGMVLTVGMAIDASILIYERIKEELQSGTAIKKAVNNGFSDAMRVILDANITTFIVGIVLYRFGTGPIQGFAVTMMLGIISTLITGLFFLRSLFNFYLDNWNVQKLRI